MSNSVWPRRRQPTRLPHPWDSPGKNTGVGCQILTDTNSFTVVIWQVQNFPTQTEVHEPSSVPFPFLISTQSSHTLHLESCSDVQVLVSFLTSITAFVFFFPSHDQKGCQQLSTWLNCHSFVIFKNGFSYLLYLETVHIWRLLAS